MKNKKAIIIALIVIALVAGIWRIATMDRGPGELDAFAACLEEKGAMFYGAFWCPHCVDQKKLFGKSADLLPYTECSTPDGKSQTPECVAKNITVYPTWEFADGSRESGVVVLNRLSEKTSCALPNK